MFESEEYGGRKITEQLAFSPWGARAYLRYRNESTPILSAYNKFASGILLIASVHSARFLHFVRGKLLCFLRVILCFSRA